MPDEQTENLIKMPFGIEVSVDLEQIKQNKIVLQNNIADTISAPDPQGPLTWTLSYQMKLAASTHPIKNFQMYDIRRSTLEIIIASQILYRLGMFLNEIIDVYLGNQALNPNYYSIDPTTNLLSVHQSHLNAIFDDLGAPWSPVLPSHEHVTFILQEVAPGSTVVKVGVFAALVAILPMVTAVNDLVTKISTEAYSGVQVIMQTDTKNEQRDVFQRTLQDQILKDLSSNNAKSLQQSLRSLNYYSGPIDGILGPVTIGALRAFEQDHHLPQLDPKSAALVYSLTSAIATKIAVSVHPRFGS